MCELIIDQLVRFLVVEPAHLGLSPRLGMGARIFLDLFQDLTALCFQWYVTSLLTAKRLWWIRKSQYLSAQYFGGAHRGRVCVRVFIGVTVRAY